MNNPMIHISRTDWAKLMRLMAAKDVHPMMHYFYAETVTRLSRPERLRIRNCVDKFLKYELPLYTGDFYKYLYPILIIVCDKHSIKYTGIIEEMNLDRHSVELGATYPEIKEKITHMWNIFRLLDIEIVEGVHIGHPEYELIDKVQKEYRKIFNLQPVRS